MPTHEKLLQIVIKLPSDFKPFGEVDREKHYRPDCSCSCKYFTKLEGDIGKDWGVCTNSQGPRKGLLTFEHMGCSFYEEINSYMD